MKNTLQFVSIQHELGMAIGLELRLQPMLVAFSRVCLRRLGLAGVHFHFLSCPSGNPTLRDGDADTTTSHYLSIPQSTPAPPAPAFNPHHRRPVDCIHRHDPFSGSHFYSFNLGNFGVVTLHRMQARLDLPVLELLKPLFVRLASSCRASIEHEDLLQAIAARKKAEETILFQLMHDDLTQLPNRRQLMQKLESELKSAIDNGTFGALLFLDLDRFKVVNDTLGHSVGDQLLVAVARKLQRLVDADGMVNRLSGDEFIILLWANSQRPDHAVARVDSLLERIHSEFSGTMQAGEHWLHMTPSTGIELFPDGNCGADQILRRADTAMYQAKLGGLGSAVYYDRQLSWELEQRREIEKELQLALKDLGQFELYYQSQHNSDGDCIGAEALIRWNNPYRDGITPDQFIPVAEETGLMLDLGRWVMRRACADIRQLQERDLPPTFRKVSINVSAIQFNHPEFVETLFSIIAESGIDSRLLAIELTESTLISNSLAAIEKMAALRSRGIDLAVDDFGTGYSSLSYLSRLPVGTVKIDQTFVRNIHRDAGNRAIVEAIVALARALGMDLIAEGVETEAEQAELAGLGCLNYQGFLFGRPAPLDAFLEQVCRPGNVSA